MIKKFALFAGFALLLSAWELMIQPSYTIKGTVTDDSGQPLIGATVLIKGTSTGAVTGIEGDFALTSRDSCVTLIFSYVGYQTEEQENSCAGAPVSVRLRASETQFDEVVVTGKEKLAARKPAKADGAIRAYEMQPQVYGITGQAMPAPRSEDYPSWNTEDYDVINENRFLRATENPLSTFSIDVDAASYSNMRRFINNGQKPPKDAVRIEEMVNYFDYEYPGPQGEHPFEVVTEIGECPWQPAHRLVHIGLQGKRIPTDNLPPSNLVFLIDVSGSMDQPNKLPLLKSSFKMLVDQLRAKDKVSIVVYAGAAGMVLPPTDGSEKQKIFDAINQLSAGGSTAGGAGIKLAYKTARENFVKGGNNRVILATDGDFNVGASSDAELVRMIEEERKSGVFLTVLGFGMGNYKDNKMQQLANKGNGNHAYIDNISEAKKVLVNEFGGTMFAIAKDVKIQVEFNPAKVAGYRLIGYENRLLNKEDFNDDKKDAGELGSGHTVTALYEIIPAGVESPLLAKVDELKYQKPEVKSPSAHSNELLTIKLRYKKPDGEESILIEKPVEDGNLNLEKTSDNFRWSAAVAEFGMLLRESEFKGNATYAHAARLAQGAKSKDEHGYRQEMIRLIDAMKALADPDVAGKE
jgi:Ca-activated chloride channel homolog